ncbi:Jag N-terminal domain-containing protein [Campylobacter sp. 9BO]|uniref:Jag N-terminal domain-containing protein n=1 Tax=Campylobacter sp. 9BO TaxID=3424759 RepID=UPI003D3399F8
MRIEASNLQYAFEQAAQKLGCSVTQLDIKVIQHPSSGFLGFFKKNAIIEAEIEDKNKNFEKNERKQDNKHEKNEHKKEHKHEKREQNLEKKQSEDKYGGQKDESHDRLKDEKKRSRNKNKKKSHQNLPKQTLSEKNDTLAHGAFGDMQDTLDEPKPEYVIKQLDVPDVALKKHEKKNILDTSIIDNFNTNDSDEKVQEKDSKKAKELVNFDEILPVIKIDLARLLNTSCFSISKIEVSKFNDECVLIELDGEDAALLIGKEGYRYKAISYLLHNWLNARYGLSIRLEVAEFLKNQEAMIEQYLLSVIERIETNGKAQTKPLDGVLVKIALEKLREKFPEKYVGIKSNGNEKFVVVNDFFKK